MTVQNAATDITTYVLITDSTNHNPSAGLTVTDFDIYYIENLTALSAKTDCTAHSAATDAHADGKAFEIGMGWYRIDWPDAAFDGGKGKKVILIVDPGAGQDDTFIEVNLSPPVNTVGLNVTDGGTISNATGTALTIASSGGNGHGMSAAGNGTGSGLYGVGGATGQGIYGRGGSSSGNGLYCTAPTDGQGIDARGAGVGGHGLYLNGAGAGAGLETRGGATGRGMQVYSGGANADGVLIVGNGTGAGIDIDAGATGIGVDVDAAANDGMEITGGGSGRDVDAVLPIRRAPGF